MAAANHRCELPERKMRLTSGIPARDDLHQAGDAFRVWRYALQVPTGGTRAANNHASLARKPVHWGHVSGAKAL